MSIDTIFTCSINNGSRRNYSYFALILLVTIALSSCTTVRITNIKTTYGERLPYQNLECSTTQPEEVDVFKETDKIDFKYEEVGFVTAYAGLEIADSFILKRLQYNSYLLCGNGIINVNASKTIKDGMSVKEYKGVSVIIEKDSNYNTKYPFKGDYSFYNFATQDYDNQVEETTPFGNLMIGVGTVATVLIFILNLGDEDEFEEEFDDGI